MKRRLLIFCAVVLFALTLLSLSSCGEPSLTLAINLEEGGTVKGGGRYAYNEDVCIEATANSGYYFLGWYHDTDLISTSPIYNCKMWDQSITLEAKFTAMPSSSDQAGSVGGSGSITNQKFLLTVKSSTPKLGMVNVDDAGLEEIYRLKKTPGGSIKALAMTSSSKRFLGWFDGQGNLIMANAVFDFVVPPFDYVLTAKWQCDEMPDKQIVSEDALKADATCQQPAEYYYTCDICGEKGKNTFFEDAVVSHTFNQQNTDEAYLKTGATCTTAAEYYYSCSCGEKGTDTFTHGFLPHSYALDWTSDENNHWHACSGAGCTAVADKATHTFGADMVCDVCNREYCVPGLLFSQNTDGTYTVTGFTGSESSVYIPATYKNAAVTAIGSSAFKGCTGLTSVTIPDSVTSIGSEAFEGCTGIQTATMPALAISSIPKTRLKTVVITSGSSIGDYAFAGCSGLTSITIPEGVTSIGSEVFLNCTGLTAVYIFDLAAWCEISFDDFTSNPLSYAQNLYLNGALVTDLLIPDGTTRIGDYAFEFCTGLTSITIPDSVTSIGNDAFWGCKSLTSITIPNSVTSIGKFAFEDCTGLTSITIGNGVTSIGYGAFKGCTGLTSVTIPNSVTSISTAAFEDCTSLTSVTIGNGVTSIGDRAFEDCWSLTSIKYRGTQSQWNAITKDWYWWDYDTGSYTITYNYTGN